jgi:hypothetical protein
VVESQRQGRRVISPLDAVRSAQESSLSPGADGAGCSWMRLRDQHQRLNVKSDGVEEAVGRDKWRCLLSFHLTDIFYPYHFLFLLFFLDFLSVCSSLLADITYPLASLYIRLSLSHALYYSCFTWNTSTFYLHFSKHKQPLIFIRSLLVQCLQL